MSSVNPSVPLPEGRFQLPPISAWVIAFLISLVAVFGVFWFVLDEWAPIALVVALGLLIATPLLLRLEKKLFWAWLLLFPVMYYDPLRISSLLPGDIPFTVPLFLLASLPGTFLSLLTRWREHGSLLRVTFPIWLIVIALGLDFLRYFTLFQPVYFIKDWINTLVTMYMLIVAWRIIRTEPDGYKWIFRAILCLGLANAVAIIFESVFRVALVEAGGFLRPMGLFGFPIMASQISMMTVALAFYGLFTTSRRSVRIFYAVTSALLLFSCVLSLTKTNIIQIGFVMLLWALFLPHATKIKALAGLAVMGALFLVWAIVFNEGALLQLLISRFTRSDTFEVRQSAWHILVSNMSWRTLLWGHGWMSATELLGIYNYEYALFPVDLMSKTGMSAIHPHNAFIKYFYELGLLGLGMLLGYIFIMIKALVLAVRHMDRPTKLANLALASIIFSMLFAGLTGTPTAENYELFYFALATLLLAIPAGWIKPLPAPAAAMVEAHREH